MAVIGNRVGFWLVYAAAWLPYAVTYSAIALALSPQPAWRVLSSTVAVVTIAAALGLAVLAAPERLGWPPRRPWRFAAIHAAAAPAYSILWAAGAFVVFSVEMSLVNGSWTPAPVASGWVPWQLLTGLLVYGTVASIAYGLHVTSRLHEQQIRAERAEALRVKAELRALRSSLDPHFLFNTLNAIAEWCREDGMVAERAILELSSMLRTVMDGVRVPSWSLQRELALCDTLLSLHLIRDPELFSLDRFVDEAALSCEVPPMLLLPLVENAMKHGPAKGHRGAVRLSLRTRGDELVFELENPGRFGGERAGGDGLATLRRRLALAYGDRARFAIGGDARTLATVSIPRAIAGASRPA